MDDCFLNWDGTCLGQKLGTAAGLVLDPSIVTYDGS